MISVRATLIFTILLFQQCLTLTGQIKPLKCKGPVPNAILSSSSQKALELLKESAAKNTEDGKVERDFTITSTFIIDDIFQSGKVLYGDTLTQTVNRIADQLLRHDSTLRGSLNFFTLRSTMVNAFSTHQGYIFVTTGLMARLENEAQLAFILGHEIAHYIKKHTLESARLESKMRKNQKEDIDDRLNQLYKYSRKHEFEADSLGYFLFKTAGYMNQDAVRALEIIGRIDESFTNHDFQDSVFQTENFELKKSGAIQKPSQDSKYFTIAKNYTTTYSENHYFDLTKDSESEAESTHPAIIKRIQRISSQKDNIKQDINHQVTTESSFRSFVLQARLEETLARLRQGDLITTLYNVSQLIGSDVDPAVLAEIRGMAYYGLAMHAVNGDEMDDFGVAENRSFGVHQVAGIYSSLNRMQICLLGARQIYRDLQIWPDEKGFREKLLDSVFKLLYILPEFEVSILNTTDCGTEKNHIKNVFCDIRDASFAAKLSRYQTAFSTLGKLESKNVQLSKIKNLQKAVVTNLSGYKYYIPLRLGIDSLLVISPSYAEYKVNNDDVERNFFKDEEIEQILKSEVYTYSDRLKMHMVVMNAAGDSTLTSDRINQYCAVTDWLEERLNHGFDPMLLYSSNSDNGMNQFGNYYVAWVNNIVVKGKRRKFRQVFFVYHPSTSELTAISLHDFKGKAGLDMIKSHMFDAFYQINMKP